MAHIVHTNTHTHPSRFQPRANEVPAIFLSHSGKQKPFVENLYDALKRANHKAFFDKHTLPKGFPFPSKIFEAVDGCKLGVVVLSDDFLTSKWPMLELERLIRKREEDPDTKVLALFFKLGTEDLKSEENLLKWRGAWKENAGQDADKWERAIKVLRSCNGEIFTPGTSETAYIERVVRVICNLMPSPILHDLFGIKGHQRFAQEVALQFEEAARQRQCDKACMVGLYGVGGLGKTTMCNIMCNFYLSQYLGKSCHIEFPSDGDDKIIVHECKKALKQLANLSDEHLLNKVDSFNQVVQLMKENLGQFDVFLAIDNVWESSLEAADRILGVSFSANSKILLTSRSEQVLKHLLTDHSNTSVGPLPSPDQQEALQIFQQPFAQGALNSLLVNRKLLHSVLKRCFFSGNYHALALKALGQYVKRVCAIEGLDKIEHILQQIGNSTALQKVDDLIRLNYENLSPEIKKHMFLDIVVVVIAAASILNNEVTYEKAHQWLSFLYVEYSKITITNLIYELALDGLIQLENIDDKSAKKMIRVHDLYSDLAQWEAARSARFFTDRSATVEEIEWEKLERVILTENHRPRFFEELQQKECRKLQVLCAENTYFRTGIYLHLMPSLCVLMLKRGTLLSIKDWSATTGLAIVHLSHLRCAPPLTPIPCIPCLEELIIEDVNTVEGPPNLHGGQHLKTLILDEASMFKEGEESWEASYFNSLKKLEILKIQNFNSITRVLNLNALVNLRLLVIRRCKSVERIEGLDALKNLQELNVQQCPYLSNLDSLSGLLQLAILMVGGCDQTLKTMPDLSGLTCLKRLQLRDNKSMEEVVGGLSPALLSVEVYGCEALKRMPDLSGLTGLRWLRLRDNKSMEEVEGGLSPALEYVVVYDCEALKRLPDLSGLTCLRELRLRRNKSMEEVVGGFSSPALECVEVRGCEALKKMPDLSGPTRLRRLELRDNKSMEEVVGGLSPALRCLEVWGCEALKRMPDLSGLTCLWRLELRDKKSMEEVVGSLSPALESLKTGCLISGVAHLCLKYLTIAACDSLSKLDVGCLPSNLKWLKVQRCIALEEIGDLSALHSLETLVLSRCPSLRTIPGVNLIPDVGCLPSNLGHLSVHRCIVLEEIGDLSALHSLKILVLSRLPSLRIIPDVSLIPEVIIRRPCGEFDGFDEDFSDDSDIESCDESSDELDDSDSCDESCGEQDECE